MLKYLDLLQFTSGEEVHIENAKIENCKISGIQSRSCVIFKCHFDNVVFENPFCEVHATFEECEFRNCIFRDDFDGEDLELDVKDSLFINCGFQKIHYRANQIKFNVSDSKFIDCNININIEVDFRSLFGTFTISKCNFDNVVFENSFCEVYPAFEECEFRKCIFRDTFKGTNCELDVSYCLLINCDFQKIRYKVYPSQSSVYESKFIDCNFSNIDIEEGLSFVGLEVQGGKIEGFHFLGLEILSNNFSDLQIKDMDLTCTFIKNKMERINFKETKLGGECEDNIFIACKLQIQVNTVFYPEDCRNNKFIDCEPNGIDVLPGGRLKVLLRGNNGIQWSIDSEGLLTISGRQTGHNSWPEWMGYEYAEKIKSVVVTAENVTSTAYWFFNCTNLTTADLSKFDTSNVTDMSWMFYGCSSLENLDMSNCDTGNVTDMSWMFKDCNRLSSMERIDLKETKSSGDCEDNKFKAELLPTNA